MQVQSTHGWLAYMEGMLLIHLVQLLEKNSSSPELFRAIRTSVYIVTMEECLVN